MDFYVASGAAADYFGAWIASVYGIDRLKAIGLYVEMGEALQREVREAFVLTAAEDLLRERGEHDAAEAVAEVLFATGTLDRVAEYTGSDPR